MSTTELPIKNGTIRIDPRHLVIKDEVGKGRNLRLFTSALWVVYGVASVLRYFKNDDQFLLWSGLLIGIAHAIVLVLTLMQSTAPMIVADHVTGITFKNRMGNHFMDIRLHNRRIRRVQILEEQKDELATNLRQHFPSIL